MAFITNPSRIVIGSMTLPFAISNKEERIKIEEWISRSAEGILGNRTVEFFFTYKKDIEATYSYLASSNVWIMLDGATFISPNGILVEMNHSEEIEKNIEKYKKQFISND